MTEITSGPDEREEIEMLLPWYVTGRLDASDRARVAAWVARDAALARQLALIEEERQESIGAAESIAPPRGASAATVMEALPRPGVLERASGWIDALLEMLSPRGLRFAAAAALVLIAAQSVGIGVLLRGAGEPGYEAASGPAGGLTDGSFVLVRLAPSAAVRDLTEALKSRNATIAGGPSADGLYRIRIGPRELPASEQNAQADALRGHAGLFELVLLEPNRKSSP
jgi:hypothetical protein